MNNLLKPQNNNAVPELVTICLAMQVAAVAMFRVAQKAKFGEGVLRV